MKIFKLFSFLLLLCLTKTFFAQSLYDMQGNVIATKTNNNQLNVTGSVFSLEEGKMIEILGGQRREDLGINYSLKEGNQVNYFNMHDELTGYYVPAENRFYRVDAKRGKEEHVALLYEGLIYTLDENPTFKIDAGFDPVFIGYVLFFFLGY